MNVQLSQVSVCERARSHDSVYLLTQGIFVSHDDTTDLCVGLGGVNMLCGKTCCMSLAASIGQSDLKINILILISMRNETK